MATPEIPFMLHMKSDQNPYCGKVIRKGFDGWVLSAMNPISGWSICYRPIRAKLDEDGDGQPVSPDLSGIADTCQL